LHCGCDVSCIGDIYPRTGSTNRAGDLCQGFLEIPHNYLGAPLYKLPRGGPPDAACATRDDISVPCDPVQHLALGFPDPLECGW